MNTAKKSFQQPRLSSAELPPVHEVEARDHLGRARQVSVPGESPLTIRVDGHEIVTLMTAGTNPEELALGYLHNQRLLERIEEIESVEVDWSQEEVNVATRHGQGIPDLAEKLSRVTVGTGCGQGTLFSCTVDKIYEQKLPRVTVRQSVIYRTLKAASSQNPIYRLAGSVHGCCLCQADKVLMAVEDVGRHNAADAIAGRMWLEGMSGHDKILYTTGRLTSEMVIKATFMGIPVFLSKSGVTQMGLELARDLGMLVIGRARANRFLVFNGWERVIFDAMPKAGGAGE